MAAGGWSLHTNPAAAATGGMLPAPQLRCPGLPISLAFWVVCTTLPFGLNQPSHLGFVVDLLMSLGLSLGFTLKHQSFFLYIYVHGKSQTRTVDFYRP